MREVKAMTRDQMFALTQRFFSSNIETIESTLAPQQPTADDIIAFAARSQYAGVSREITSFDIEVKGWTPLGPQLTSDEIALFSQCVRELTPSYYRGGIVLSPATETPIRLRFGS